MKRALKIFGWTIGGAVLLVGLAVAAVVVFISSDYARAQVENRASAYSGRKTEIGKIAVRWGETLHIRLDNVAIANTDWAKADHMFKAELIELDVRAWPLLRGDLILPHVHLGKPEIYLERNAKDASNWDIAESPVAGTAAKQVAPDNRFEAPVVGELVIDDGHLGYRDAMRALDLDGTVQTAIGQAGAQPQAEFRLKGSIEKRPLALHFIGGSVLMLRETDKPYPVNLDVTYGDTHLTAKGTLQDPIAFKGADVQLTLSGSNLANIYPLLGIPGPPTPPYRIAGKLDHEPGKWHVTNMTWHAGDSDLSGDITVDQDAKPALLKANLVSDHLAFADLAPLVGANPGKTGNVSAEQKRTAEQLEAKGDLFPNVPLHTERLRAMNMDVTLDARKVTAPSYLPVSAIAARVQVTDGQALVQPLKMTLGGGTVSGSLAIDARTDNPVVRSKLDLRDIELATFFRGSRFFDTTKGKMHGRVDLVGTGKSLAQVMGDAQGRISAAMTDGSVSSLGVSLAGLQIADALVLYITGDNRIPIRCAIGKLDFDHGIVTFNDTLMDTRQSVLHFNGRVDLGTQIVGTKITADPKKFDFLDLHGPILVEGKIRSPSVTIGRLIPIPTPDFGGAKDVDCDQRIRQLLTTAALPDGGQAGKELANGKRSDAAGTEDEQ